jgi:hypothetical protein
MPNNEIWSDNFSPNLHVGIVRINKYMKDPNSGALTFIEEVRPSRIVLRTGFVEGQSALDQSHNLALDGNRCYAVPQALISGDQPFVDFSECHVGSPDLPNFGDPQTLMVTPTNFDDFDPTTSNDRPTWFVEFNDVGTEAAPAPVLGENQVLLIEFGISANA